MKEYHVTVPKSIQNIIVVGEKNSDSILWGRSEKQPPETIWYTYDDGLQESEEFVGTITDSIRRACAYTTRVTMKSDSIVSVSVSLSLTDGTRAIAYMVNFDRA